MPWFLYFSNLLRHSDAYMSQQTTPSLLQIMVCRLFGNNPLSEPMMVYCQLDPTEHISITFYLKFKGFHSRKCIWKCLQNWQPFCVGLNVVIYFHGSTNNGAPFGTCVTEYLLDTPAWLAAIACQHWLLEWHLKCIDLAWPNKHKIRDRHAKLLNILWLYSWDETYANNETNNVMLICE